MKLVNLFLIIFIPITLAIPGCVSPISSLNLHEKKKGDNLKGQSLFEYSALSKLSDKELIENILSINTSYETSSDLWNGFTSTPIDAYSGELLVLRVIGERGTSIVPILISSLNDVRNTDIKLFFDFDDNNKKRTLDIPIKLQLNYVCILMLRKIMGGAPAGGESFGFIISTDESRKIKQVWEQWWKRNKNKSRSEYSKDNFISIGE